MQQPLVSVLVTCYNGLPYIKKALDHLLAQTYSNIEIIVIDDHSVDGTGEYLAELATTNPKIHFYKNPVKGRGKALNFGLSKCSGEFVAINDADDYSLPERIEKQVRFMQENPDYGLVGSMSSLIQLEYHPREIDPPSRDQ
jgi:glycosyltransferase involved in cell wall biosynthesis